MRVGIWGILRKDRLTCGLIEDIVHLSAAKCVRVDSQPAPDALVHLRGEVDSQPELTKRLSFV